jgi:uncharacterized membrane protein YagU involved in acid resistance
VEILRNSIIAGLIAGFFAGIAATIIKISNLHGWFSITPYESIPFNMQIIAQVEMIWHILWGIIFGVFYAFFYDYISGTGVKKGIIYGLIIWIIVNFRFAAINAVYGYYQWSIPDALSGFFAISIVYGLVLGYLYKPPK